MRVLVCGGRGYHDRQTVFRILDEISETCDPVYVIHGGASGADAYADLWALRRRQPCARYPANWNRYGKAAGPIRNEWMLNRGRPDLVVAFPGEPAASR